MSTAFASVAVSRSAAGPCTFSDCSLLGCGSPYISDTLLLSGCAACQRSLTWHGWCGRQFGGLRSALRSQRCGAHGHALLHGLGDRVGVDGAVHGRDGAQRRRRVERARGAAGEVSEARGQHLGQSRAWMRDAEQRSAVRRDPTEIRPGHAAAKPRTRYASQSEAKPYAAEQTRVSLQACGAGRRAVGHDPTSATVSHIGEAQQHKPCHRRSGGCSRGGRARASPARAPGLRSSARSMRSDALFFGTLLASGSMACERPLSSCAPVSWTLLGSERSTLRHVSGARADRSRTRSAPSAGRPRGRCCRPRRASDPGRRT